MCARTLNTTHKSEEIPSDVMMAFAPTSSRGLTSTSAFPTVPRATAGMDLGSAYSSWSILTPETSTRTVSPSPGWSPFVAPPTFLLPNANRIRGVSAYPALTWIRTETSSGILYGREAYLPHSGTQAKPIHGRGNSGSQPITDTDGDEIMNNVETLCAVMSKSRFAAFGPDIVCNFCKRNGEMKRVYTTHRLIEHGKITCPILRKYVCPICGATGDNAHTISYCPLGNGVSSIAATRTPKKSCGCARKCRHSNSRHN